MSWIEFGGFALWSYYEVYPYIDDARSQTTLG